MKKIQLKRKTDEFEAKTVHYHEFGVEQSLTMYNLISQPSTLKLELGAIKDTTLQQRQISVILSKESSESEVNMTSLKFLKRK